MDVVPSINSQFVIEVEAILNAAGRENLPVLNPGSGFNFNVDKTSDTYKEFDFKLFVAFTEILKNNWVHAWPTYRFIPFHYKKKWFFTLARKYTWDPRHTLTVWTQFNLTARQVYIGQMRDIKYKLSCLGEKPEWMNMIVWKDLSDMFNELGYR